jgi:hypothetical protein
MAADISAAAATLSREQLRQILRTRTLLPNLLTPPTARNDSFSFHGLAENILADRTTDDAAILFSAVTSLSTLSALRDLLSGVMAYFVQLWNSDVSLADRSDKVAEFLYQTSACLAVSVPCFPVFPPPLYSC